jgi:membrane protein
MALSHPNGQSQRRAVAKAANPEPPRQSRARNASGRQAEAAPAAISAKGWKEIARRSYENAQGDRLLLVAAGVTFYGLLALFPATAAIVSLYGLFADPLSLNDHLRLISGFLPDGALEVIGDQVKRIAAHGQATLGFAFLGTLALSLWGANAGTKSIFDALNIIFKERETRGFIKLTFWSLTFTIGAVGLALLSLVGIIAVPLALNFLGLSQQLDAKAPRLSALAIALPCGVVRARLPLSLRP